MTPALVVLRVALALVFGAAGAGKLLDRPGTHRALGEFGVPGVLVAPAALLLPVVELVVAAALLVHSSAAGAAIAAVVLLVIFDVGVANSLLHGRKPACHCFGQLRASAASWVTVGRNAALAAVAAVVAVAAWDRGEPATASFVTLAVLIDLTAALMLAFASRAVPWLSLTRLEARLAARPRLLLVVGGTARIVRLVGLGGSETRGLPIGSRAPDFRVRDSNGSWVTLTSLLNEGKPTMLVFGDPGCRPCVALLPTVVRWQRDHRNRLTIAVITSGSLEEKLGMADGAGIESVLVQDDREVARAYEADVMPSAVLVTADGRIASRLAIGELPIHTLVESLVARPPVAPERAAS